MVICCQWSRILLSALLGQKSAFAFEPLVEREKKTTIKPTTWENTFMGLPKTPQSAFHTEPLVLCSLTSSPHHVQPYMPWLQHRPDPQPSAGNPQPTTSVGLHAAAAPMEKCNGHVHSDPHCYPKHAELWDSLTSTWVTSNAHHREKSSCT